MTDAFKNIVTGAFYGLENGNVDGGHSQASDYITVVGFEASRSSPIYGASSTVHPNSLQLLPCIKF